MSGCENYLRNLYFNSFVREIVGEVWRPINRGKPSFASPLPTQYIQNLDFDIGSNVSRAYFFSIWFSLKNEMIKSWDPPPSSIPPSPPLLQYFRIIGQLSQRARAPSRSPPKSVQCLAGGEHSELVSANYKVKQTNRLTANRLMGQQAGSSIWSEQQDELTISQTHTLQI